MKSQEIREQIETMTSEMRSAIEAKDVTKAKEIRASIDEQKELLALTETIEAEERASLESQKQTTTTEGRGINTMENVKVNEFRAIVKSVIGKEMSAEERAVVKSDANGAVLPKQFVNELQEIKKGFGSIRELCDIYPVTKNTGSMPVVDLDQNTLPEVAEGDNITEGTLATTEITFNCKKHGLLQNISSELIEDAEVEIETIVRKNFAELATRVENTKIVKVLTDNFGTVKTGTDYTAIAKYMDAQVPAVKNGMVVLTNENGFAYLKNAVDAQGRNLGLVTEMSGKYYFNGKELAVVDSAIMPNETTKVPYFVANMKEAVKIFDRKQLTVAKSTEAGFSTDTTKVRVLERLDVCKGSTRSIAKFLF